MSSKDRAPVLVLVAKYVVVSCKSESAYECCQGTKLRLSNVSSVSLIKFLELKTLTAINIDESNVSWAAAGSNATLYLTSIDPIHLNIGSVLCSPGNLVPLATVFIARIIIFDIQVPITSGTSVRVFACPLADQRLSSDVPA